VRPASQALLRAVRSSHGMAVRAAVRTAWASGVSPGGEEIAVIDGDVTLNATAQVTGTLSLTTDGTGWSPQPGKHPLQPYGTELYVERGVLVSGSVEWCSLGYYKITEVDQATAPNGNLSVQASDRMQGIIDAQVVTPVQFTAGQTVADVFTQLVGGVYPEAEIEYDWDAASDTLGAAQVTQQDRYGFLNDLLLSRGKIMWWDYRGVLVVKAQPPGSGDPVSDVTGGEGGVIVSGQRTLTRDAVYNAVVVTADGADTTQAPLAVVIDDNPQSPTYWYGPFGQVPQFYSSSAIVTGSQALAAGTAMLAKSLQLPFQVSFTCIPNPALEPYDLVRVNYGPQSSDELHIIDTLTIPLTSSAALSGTAHDPHNILIGVLKQQ
jgi:hypothetical protein